MFRSLRYGALLALAPTAAAAQSLTSAETAQIDAVVAKALADSGTPSASIAVVRGGRIVLAKAYGKASEAIPVARPDLPYQIASISKQFTAAAILLLQDQGKLSLDDPVAKYVPGITDGDHITIRQLLSHTAGLRDYWPQDYDFEAMSHPVTPRQIVDRWAKAPLDFAPGTQWQYSNTGYVVAGLIVEKASGRPLLDFLRERVFQPLGMTSVIDQDKAVGAAYPAGYHRYALGPVRVEQPAAPGWLFAAGELSMTATDLARWDIARMDRALLPADDWRTQETEMMLADGRGSGYGLGVSIGRDTARRPTVSHDGEAVGFLSQNIVYPAQKTAIVVLTNADFGDAFTAIAARIGAIVLPPEVALAASGDETAVTAKARATFDALARGTLDRRTMTADANYYFTPTALADYRASLGALGTPSAFVASRSPRLRGGFVNRNYRVSYPDGRTLSIVTYAEPGANGRYEQFMVTPAQ